MTYMFVHGVPDTPYMWTPLLDALDLPDEVVMTPALPGFAEAAPKGFPATKEAYTDWLIGELVEANDRSGRKVNIVGHDWGAILTLRAASLRPDLVETWAVTNALIDTTYRGHRMARMWNAPIIGELMMGLSAGNPKRLADGLHEAGMPRDIANHEAKFWTKSMRQSILKLYRSARGLRFEQGWEDDLANLPERGQLLWGEGDPYVDVKYAHRFHERWGTPLHVLEGVGHWGAIQKPDEAAAVLKAHWAGETPKPGPEG